MSCLCLNYGIFFFFLKKKNFKLICLTSKFFFFLFICINLKINIVLNLIFFKKEHNCFKLQTNIKKLLNFFLKKIIFEGRGFKIEKKKKIQFNFTKTFKSYFITKNNAYLKLKKNKLIGISKKNKMLELNQIFYFNKFTKKGLRYSQTKIKIKK